MALHDASQRHAMPPAIYLDTMVFFARGLVGLAVCKVQEDLVTAINADGGTDAVECDDESNGVISGALLLHAVREAVSFDR